MFPVLLLPVYPVCTVRYSLLAGEIKLASYAWEEAMSHFQLALSAKGVPSTGVEAALEERPQRCCSDWVRHNWLRSQGTKFTRRLRASVAPWTSTWTLGTSPKS